jgi:L-Ala-D/L-Glu epimerase
VEQPLPARHPDGPRVKAASPLPIYVDEDCHTPEDLAACAERAHGVNVKLTKCGGIAPALRMAEGARELGLGLMLGCMAESSLGIAAACQLASLFDQADLDGNLLLADDPWEGVELVQQRQVPADRPGLGVRRRREPLSRG